MSPASSIGLRLRRLGAIVALLTVASLLATPAAIASPSLAVPRASRRALPHAPTSEMTLAQAPKALQAAVRSTLAGPTQEAELTESGAGNFGRSVGISGSTAVVGAPSTPYSLIGAAYVYTASGGIWTLQAELTASDGAMGDFFGWSVGISGSTIAVSATGKLPKAAVYVFVRSGSVWSQQAELTASDGASGTAFGSTVAISGSTVAVGDPYKNSLTGAAYAFVRSGGIWSQQAELTASDGTSIDRFGSSVSLSGSTMVVGAWGHNLYTGAAYVFVRSGGIWSQKAELTASDGAMKDSFGLSVAISGSTVVVGAEGKNGAAGASYVFTASGGIWTQQAELTASDGMRNDYFGSSVAVSGSTALVGAWGRDSGTGAAYIFTPPGGIWSRRAELTASDGASGDVFGWSVALYRSTFVVGAFGKDTASGAAYLFVNG